MGYHQQGALVWLNAADALEHPFESFMLMFIETARPFCARTVPLMDDDLARGRARTRAMLKRIRACLDADHFPGPGEGELRALALSNGRERARIDERLKLEGVALTEKEEADQRG